MKSFFIVCSLLFISALGVAQVLPKKGVPESEFCFSSELHEYKLKTNADYSLKVQSLNSFTLGFEPEADILNF